MKTDDLLKLSLDTAFINGSKALDELERVDCEENLVTFLRRGWKYIDPSSFKGGWHLDAVADHLAAVTSGQIRRLVINIPPRFTKSSLCAVAWPAWTWAQREIAPLAGPHVQFLFSSYSQVLAERDSIKTHRLVSSPWYQCLWGDRVQLITDNKRKFETAAGGYRLATSTGGTLTGEGAAIIVCLPNDVHITTDRGDIPIGQLVREKIKCRVLGYDIVKGECVWQEIEEFEENGERDVYEFDTGDRTLRCTGDHPIYVINRGWVSAEQARQGDRVVDLRDVWESHGVSPGSRSEESLLQSPLSGTLANWGKQLFLAGGQAREYLFALWQEIFGRHYQIDSTEILFETMCSDMPVGASNPHPVGGLRDLWNYGTLQAERSDLFQRMCEQTSFAEDAGERERQLASGELELRRLDKRPYPKARWLQMCALWFARRITSSTIARAPYRSQSSAQRKTEFDMLMHVVSQASSQGKDQISRRMEGRAIRSIRRCGKEAVYNVRVTPNHNYFANGVLTHNCDDPHNATEIESQAHREMVTQWWDEALSTRLNDISVGAYVIVMQRLFADDITGHVLTREEGLWTHLCLPLEYEPNYHCATGIRGIAWPEGFSDPRTEEGELLCPDRIPASELPALKRRLGTFGSVGQLQQHPEPRGGGILLRDWWKAWPPEVDELFTPAGKPLKSVLYPEMDFILASVDMANTEKEENDFSAMSVWGIFRDKRDMPQVILMEAWEERLPIHEATIKIIELCARRKVDRLLIEAKAAGHSVEQEIRRLVGQAATWTTVLEPVKGDKVARAYACEPTWAAGQVWAPARNIDGEIVFFKWAQRVIDQCASLPKGAYDDLADTATQAINHMRRSGLLLTKDEQSEMLRLRHRPPGNREPLYDVMG